MKNIHALALLLCLNGFAIAGERLPQIVWGAVTNDCRAGIRIQTVFEKGGEGIFSPTVLYFGTTNSSRVVEAYKPPENERFLAVLRGSDGKEIPKTRLGKKYGIFPSKRARFDDHPTRGPKRWQVMWPSTTMDSQACSFNILDHFAISKPDIYTLVVELRVYRRVGNGELQIERLLPCSVKFQTY